MSGSAPSLSLQIAPESNKENQFIDFRLIQRRKTTLFPFCQQPETPSRVFLFCRRQNLCRKRERPLPPPSPAYPFGNTILLAASMPMRWYIAQAASTIGIASAAPLPSPRRMPILRYGSRPVRQRDTRPLLRRIVGRDQIRFHLRRYLTRRQRRRVGEKAIQHHRQPTGRRPSMTPVIPSRSKPPTLLSTSRPSFGSG